MRRAKLTNNSDEADISKLLSGDSIFSIPYFQRPYKWKPERLRRLEEDILKLIDETSDSHFLGAVIIHGRRRNPSDPTIFEVIDGQQRLTTIFLYIAALIRFLCRHKQYDDALGLFQRYLTLGRQTGLLSNLKLHPCREDRNQMNRVMLDITSDESFRQKLGSFAPVPLPNTGSDDGILYKNYRSAVRFLEDQFKQAGDQRITQIVHAILELISVVQIDVFDPTNGPKIFNSLNSRQEPMTIGDLVRNEVFSRVANEHADIVERLDRDEWQPFYEKFKKGEKSLFDSYFFPFGLIHDPNISKSEVFGFLRDKWKSATSPSDIIAQLARYQNAFLDIANGSNLQGHPKKVATAFAKLYRLGAPSSTAPFLMQLSQIFKEGGIDEASVISILALIESFLVRRAVCGIEPTGLHAVFKRLWNDTETKRTAGAVEAAIRRHATVVWPDNELVKREIQTRSLYGAAIAPFLIAEYDHSLAGDIPKNSPWIEHVLPITPDDAWWKDFTKEQHKDTHNLFANLIPLSSEMNRSLSNEPYSTKRPIYSGDSMYKSARQFSQDYDRWTPVELKKRGEILAEWMILRWPG